MFINKSYICQQLIKGMNLKYEINILIACILLSSPFVSLEINFYKYGNQYTENNDKRNE